MNGLEGMSGSQKVELTVFSLIGAAVITLIGCVTLYNVQSNVSERRTKEAFIEAGYEQASVPGVAGTVWVKAKCQCGEGCKCSLPVEP